MGEMHVWNRRLLLKAAPIRLGASLNLSLAFFVRILFSFVVLLFITGCAIQCKQATFHRYAAVEPVDGIDTSALRSGGVMLQNDSGLAMTLSSCWSTRERINADICLTIFLSKEHRFQFLDTNFTAFGWDGNATTYLALEPLTLGAHKFDPSLELTGGNVDTNSVWKEEHWFKYQTKVLRGIQMGTDFDLLLPRIAIDGKNVSLPRITVRTVQDKLCSIQQLM